MISSVKPTISAVVITRNRPGLLRKTLFSLQQSQQPFTQIIVSDDSTDVATSEMLAKEFPGVIWRQGPRTGRSGNRNTGFKANSSDYVMMCDDDIIVDPTFAGAVLKRAMETPEGLFFPAISENERSFLPNALDFLGFCTRPYAPGELHHTAHSQCFILSRTISDKLLYDEIISMYGYEEFDFAYRVAAAGFPILPMPECVCTHLAPNPAEPFRQGLDANRLYMMWKRHYYLDRAPLTGVLFLLVALPHHLLTSFKRAGWKGFSQAWDNVKLAASMLRKSREAATVGSS